MRNIRIVILGFGLLCCSLISSSAQSFTEKVNHSIAIGYPFQILDKTTSGLYLAYNPIISMNKFLSLEFQLAGAFVRSTAFLSGEPGNFVFVHYHGGLRLQNTDSTRKLKPYLSLLGGLSSGYLTSADADEGKNRYSVASFSAGLFVEYDKKFALGASIENYREVMLVLKAKYTL